MYITQPIQNFTLNPFKTHPLFPKDIMLGQEASDLRSMLEVNYPMDNGIVRNWDDMILVWEYTFKEMLNIDPTHCKVGICVSSFNHTILHPHILLSSSDPID